MSSGAEQNNTILKLHSVSKSFSKDEGLKVSVLKDISFEISATDKGSITTILAPFGSGKSTLLKIISGLIQQTSGEITFANTNKKSAVYIPEKPSSLPWLNVTENIKIGLKQSEDKKRFNEIISLVGLKGYEDHSPDNKSSGFRFRISLARALALDPLFILIDDSFKLIKNQSREELYKIISNISNQKKQNFIIATTNLIEAINLSEKIILISKKPGRVIKIIDISEQDKTSLKDYKSEKFTLIKTEIEDAFRTAESVSTINYSV